MKIQIELSKWYAYGHVKTNDDYYPCLENSDGLRCCLGFCALAHGAQQVVGYVRPGDIVSQLSPRDWMLNDEEDNSALAIVAMDLNDGNYADGINWSLQPLEVRMGNLITVFLEGGDELEFVL